MLPEFVARVKESAGGDGGVRVGISSAGGDEFDGDGGGTVESLGLRGGLIGAAVGEALGAPASLRGPGATIVGGLGALHLRGTPGMLQALGRDIAMLGLIGIWKGMPPVTIRHIQFVALIIIVLTALQQSSVGEVDPLLLLFVKKFTQGVKLVIIGPVHGVLIIWPSTC